MVMKSVMKRSYLHGIVLFLMVCSVPIIAARKRQKVKKSKSETTRFVLQSSAFAYNGLIPEKYTCDSEDEVSPPLRWLNAPKGTESFALICEDPDATGGKTWIHWVVFNIPATVSDFPANAKIEALQATEGMNSWGSSGYGGPCPPLKTHRYIFTMYALKVPKLSLRGKVKRDDVMRAMKGNMLDKAVLIGKYQRSKKK